MSLSVLLKINIHGSPFLTLLGTPFFRYRKDSSGGFQPPPFNSTENWQEEYSIRENNTINIFWPQNSKNVKTKNLIFEYFPKNSFRNELHTPFLPYFTLHM